MIRGHSCLADLKKALGPQIKPAASLVSQSLDCWPVKIVIFCDGG